MSVLITRQHVQSPSDTKLQSAELDKITGPEMT
jgi:hypothetical protein